MTGNHSDLPTLPLRLTLLQVLGLRDPGEGDWARLRGLQYAEIHTVAPLRIGSQVLAGTVAVSLFLGQLSGWVLAAWFAALVATLWNQTRIDRRFVDIDRRRMTRGEYWGQLAAVVFPTTLSPLP